MQHLLRPGPARSGRQLEHRPVAVVSAALVRRAVEIAGGIEDQGGQRLNPVRAVVVEVMQHLLRPGSARSGRQLEHRPVAVGAASVRRAVEIAGAIEDLQANLDREQFWRVHRSYLVNINRIKEVVPWFKSSYQLRMDDRKHTEIPVSRVQTRRLRELFKL